MSNSNLSEWEWPLLLRPKGKQSKVSINLLSPSVHKLDKWEIQYVTGRQIKEFHTKEFCEKFDREYYGSTGMMIEENGQQILAIYYEDYERFARKILLGTPTHWD